MRVFPTMMALALTAGLPAAAAAQDTTMAMADAQAPAAIEETAVLAREHNDANVVSVGGRMHTVEDMTRFVEVFLATPFPGDERHVRRIEMLADYEKTGNLPPLPESALGHGQE